MIRCTVRVFRPLFPGVLMTMSCAVEFRVFDAAKPGQARRSPFRAQRSDRAAAFRQSSVSFL
jgi:hypothetical protein